MGRKHLAVAVVVAAALAALLRAPLVDRQPLWADEVFSLAVATGHSLEHPAREADPERGDYVEPPGAVPAARFQAYLAHGTPPATPGQVIRAVRLSDTSPPLYYLLLHVWTRWFGTTDAALRGFSLLVALACIPVLAAVGRQVGGRVTALMAIGLFAVSPVAVYYSTEGRMYALVWLLSLGLVGLTIRITRHAVSPWWLGLWSVTAAAGLLTHYFYAFVVAAAAAWLVLAHRRAGPRLAAALLVTAVVVAPWYWLVPTDMARWRVTGTWLFQPLGLLGLARGPFRLAGSLISGNGYWGGSPGADILVVSVLALVAFLLLASRVTLRPASPATLLVAVLTAVCVGPAVLDAAAGTKTTTIARYAAAGLPVAMLLLARGFSAVPRRGGVALLIVLLGAWMPGLHAMWTATSRLGHDFAEVGRMLKAEAGPADVIIVHSTPSGVLGVARYLEPETPVASWVGQLGQRAVPRDVVALGENRARAVVVEIHPVGAPAEQRAWLQRHARPVAAKAAGKAKLTWFAPITGDVLRWDRPAAGR